MKKHIFQFQDFYIILNKRSNKKNKFIPILKIFKINIIYLKLIC